MLVPKRGCESYPFLKNSVIFRDQIRPREKKGDFGQSGLVESFIIS